MRQGWDLQIHEMGQLSLTLSLVSCSIAENGNEVSQKYYRQDWLVRMSSDKQG
jgi:hypothetical protein